MLLWDSANEYRAKRWGFPAQVVSVRQWIVMRAPSLRSSQTRAPGLGTSSQRTSSAVVTVRSFMNRSKWRCHAPVRRVYGSGHLQGECSLNGCCHSLQRMCGGCVQRVHGLGRHHRRAQRQPTTKKPGTVAGSTCTVQARLREKPLSHLHTCGSRKSPCKTEACAWVWS
jgi:hypothetical protein